MNSKFEPNIRLLVFLLFTLFFFDCTHRAPRDGRNSDAPESFEGRTDVGYASWYGDQFHGKKTASGETYDMYAMTAAHRRAPFGTQVRVTNLDNGRQTMVKINDRGPFVRGRIIDLSRKAAEEIGMVGSGTAKVKLEFLDQAPIDRGDIYVQTASFGSQSNAQDYLSTLQKTLPDLNARIYSENNLYRIRTGPYADLKDAEEIVRRLKRSGFDGLILHTP